MASPKDRDKLYAKVFALFKEHHTPAEIARKLGIPPAQVLRAVNRRLKDHFNLSGPDKVRAAIAIKEDHVRRLNERLAKVQAGLTEMTHKQGPRGSEVSEAEKFYVSAEVSLLKEIRATENEINELRGLLQLSKAEGEEADEVKVTIRLDQDEA